MKLLLRSKAKAEKRYRVGRSITYLIETVMKILGKKLTKNEMEFVSGGDSCVVRCTYTRENGDEVSVMEKVKCSSDAPVDPIGGGGAEDPTTGSH